jgi:hypothetical protein
MNALCFADLLYLREKGPFSLALSETYNLLLCDAMELSSRPASLLSAARSPPQYKPLCELATFAQLCQT